MDELARSHLAPLPSKPNARQVSEKGGSEGGRRRKERGETAAGLRSVALHPAGGLGRAAPGRVRTARRDRTGPCAEFGAGALGPLATSGQARGPRTEAHAAGRGAEPAVSGVKRSRTGGARETRRGGTQGAARRAGRGPGGAEGGAGGAGGAGQVPAAAGSAGWRHGPAAPRNGTRLRAPHERGGPHLVRSLRHPGRRRVPRVARGDARGAPRSPRSALHPAGGTCGAQDGARRWRGASRAGPAPPHVRARLRRRPWTRPPPAPQSGPA